MKKIYHITTQIEWYQAKVDGKYTFCSLETEGFIHCSLVSQYLKVANFRFKGKENLILLEIDEEKVSAKVVYENLEGGVEDFPHIYGPLNIEAVVNVYQMLTDETGNFIACH